MLEARVTRQRFRAPCRLPSGVLSLQTHTAHVRTQAQGREDVYLRNNSLAKEPSLLAGETGQHVSSVLTPGYSVIHGFIFSFRQTPLFPPCHSIHRELGSKMVFLIFPFTRQLLPLHGGGKMQTTPCSVCAGCWPGGFYLWHRACGRARALPAGRGAAGGRLGAGKGSSSLQGTRVPLCCFERHRILFFFINFTFL